MLVINPLTPDLNSSCNVLFPTFKSCIQTQRENRGEEKAETKNSQHSCTRMTIIGWCICYVVWGQRVKSTG